MDVLLYNFFPQDCYAVAACCAATRGVRSMLKTAYLEADASSYKLSPQTSWAFRQHSWYFDNMLSLR